MKKNVNVLVWICSLEKTNLSVIWLSLNRSQCGSCSTKYNKGCCHFAVLHAEIQHIFAVGGQTGRSNFQNNIL